MAPNRVVAILALAEPVLWPPWDVVVFQRGTVLRSNTISPAGGRSGVATEMLVMGAWVGKPGAVPLSNRQQAILDFERTWWQLEGSKESAIRERFALSTTRYYQLLNELLDLPEAAGYDPLVVRRLQRLRTRRRRARFGVSATNPPAR